MLPAICSVHGARLKALVDLAGLAVNSVSTSSRRPSLSSAGRAARGFAGRAVQAILEFDDRMVNRADPHPDGPVPVGSIPWAKGVIDEYPRIADELHMLLDRGVRLPTTTEFAGEDQYADGEWSTYVMAWYGDWISETCDRMPHTTAVLQTIPNVQIAGFTVLGPHTRLERHTGPAKSLRFQVGIEVPTPEGTCGIRIGDTTFIWHEGGAVAFDDRSPHEAWNDSDESRYVLFAQVPWPVSGAAGWAHRSIHRMLGLFIRDYARRARELDGALNGGI